MNDYQTRFFSPGYFQSVQRLFVAAFNLAVSLKSYQKKYNTAALGAKAVNFICVEEKSNEVVAHYAALPFTFLVNGTTGLAAQASDAMTDEAHRKKGLFKQLANEVHNECKAQGVGFIISQPNNASHHSFLHVFNFQQVDSIIRWDLKLRIKTAPLGKRLIVSKYRTAYLGYCNRVLKKHLAATPQSMTNSISSTDARVLRNESYLAYKKAEDSFFIKLDGALLWIKLTDVLWIGEVENYSQMKASVITKLRRLAFLLGYNTIAFHLNEKVQQPAFLKHFKKYKSEPSTILYLDENYSGINIILTGVDFDTW